MRSRPELPALIGLILVLAVALVLAGRGRGVTGDDPRRSTFLAGPSGARGLADALGRLGIEVERSRRRVEAIDSAATSRPGTLFAVLGPSRPLDGLEGERLARLTAAGANLLLAGASANAAMRCFGYDVRPLTAPAAALEPDLKPPHATPWVRAVLSRSRQREVVDSAAVIDGRVASCTVPSADRDTLLLTSWYGVVALRLRLHQGGQVILVADDRLFSNRALRSTDAGPFVLRLLGGRFGRVVFDEYHHGFGRGGSLWRAALSWSLDSPWGRALWQLVAVGVLGLLAAGVRFGPVRQVIDRRRRSSLEHVRALATVLAAARGQRVAVRLLVHGLARRLARGGRLHEDPVAWLPTLERGVRTPRGRSALSTLQDLTRAPGEPDQVRRAAHAVEDLWEELRPS